MLCAVADIHLGNHRRFGGEVVCGMNARCRSALLSFELAVMRAVKLGADAFVVLGDLFDDDEPTPQLIAAVQDIFKRGQDASQRVDGSVMRFILIEGNHEQRSTQRGDHALGPLRPFAEVIDSPQVVVLSSGYALVCVPFSPSNAHDYVGKAAASALRTTQPPSDYVRVLCAHVGVRDERTAHYLADAPDSIHVDALRAIADVSACRLVLTGNWHDRRVWRPAQGERAPVVVQVGALVPTGFDNPGLEGYGGLAVVGEPGRGVRIESISGPRFITMTCVPQGPVPPAFKVADARYYMRAVVPLAKRAEALDALQRWSVEAAGTIAGVCVDIDARGAVESGVGVVESLRAQDSVEQAVSEYVTSLGLDASDAPLVVKAAMHFLRGA